MRELIYPLYWPEDDCLLMIFSLKKFHRKSLLISSRVHLTKTHSNVTNIKDKLGLLESVNTTSFSLAFQSLLSRDSKTSILISTIKRLNNFKTKSLIILY